MEPTFLVSIIPLYWHQKKKKTKKQMQHLFSVFESEITFQYKKEDAKLNFTVITIFYLSNLFYVDNRTFSIDWKSCSTNFFILNKHKKSCLFSCFIVLLILYFLLFLFLINYFVSEHFKLLKYTLKEILINFITMMFKFKK